MRMVIGYVVANIGASRIPIVTELSLGFAESNPIETHIHGFGLFGDNGIVGDSHCYVIVSVDIRMGSIPTHLYEGQT